jgi:hypothetical protein
MLNRAIELLALLCSDGHVPSVVWLFELHICSFEIPTFNYLFMPKMAVLCRKINHRIWKLSVFMTAYMHALCFFQLAGQKLCWFQILMPSLWAPNLQYSMAQVFLTILSMVICIQKEPCGRFNCVAVFVLYGLLLSYEVGAYQPIQHCKTAYWVLRLLMYSHMLS